MNASGPTVLVDGIAEDRVPVSDRGLQYGDGLFETIAVQDGIPQFWDRHWNRLAAGCSRLRLTLPEETLVRQEVGAVSTGPGRAVVKLMLTRGSGGRGYRADPQARPRRIVSRHPWPDHPPSHARDGVRVRWCDHRLPAVSMLAGIKHLNRLDQVMARSEWDDPAVAEGLMQDTGGRIIEGTMSNLFLGIDGLLLTPCTDAAGVGGVMRDWLFERARVRGVPVQESELHPGDVARAQEMFLCNSIIGIWPVAEIVAGRRFSAPGPLTRMLQAELGRA